MISFLPVSILAYSLNGGAVLVDKILIKKSFPHPISYTFYTNILQFAALLLIPFGFHFTLDRSAYLAIFSGILSVFALFAFFTSLKTNEASIVGPVVGVFNPVFSLILGGIFLQQFLTSTQYLAFIILIAGTILLTLNLWISKVKFSKKFVWIVIAGFLFGLSYILLRESFLGTSFINVLIISRVSAAFFVLSFLLFPAIKKQIFFKKTDDQHFTSKTTILLMASGQGMAAVAGLLTTFAVSLANPAIVNAVFGVQYPIILITALILAKKHPDLLDETLSKGIVIQKIIGILIISLGLYLLAK